MKEALGFTLFFSSISGGGYLISLCLEAGRDWLLFTPFILFLSYYISEKTIDWTTKWTVEPKLPNYTVGICCERCEKPMKECDCVECFWHSQFIDDEVLEDPRHNQAKEINRKFER